jgi:hypothetical protein
MWFLLFVKQLPILAIAEIKEVLPPAQRRAHALAGDPGGGAPQKKYPEKLGRED